MEQLQRGSSAVLEKDTWGHQEYQELLRDLLASNDPPAKAREVLTAVESGGDLKGAAALKAGIARYVACRFADALTALSSATDNKDRHWFAALCHKQLGQWTKAREELVKAAEKGWDAAQAMFESIELDALAGKLDEAQAALKKIEGASGSVAQFHYLRGLVAEMRSDHVGAASSYGKAREIQPDHTAATFRLGALHDQFGDEDLAIELYRQSVSRPPVFANALLNLAVIYEDRNMNEQALACINRVLATDASHPRARLFRKDIEASRTMYYDEDQARRIAKRNAVLDIPVTDFELSVRARNCLKKMNIRSLGDLVRTSEAELLSYKNFGETSLKEIKDMLTAKGLRLGQALEEGSDFSMESAAPAVAAPPSLGNEGVLGTPIEQVEFSIRARRALQNLGIRSLGELAARSETELLSCRNFGQTSLNEVRQRLAEYGLRLQEG